MRIGLMFANTGPGVTAAGAAEVARRAESAGFDSLWTVEHVVVPGTYSSTYPYNSSGRMPGGEDQPIPDPFVWLAFVAANTERLLLGTAMLILPQRSPLITAKEAATLDVLSRGRFRLGVGIGWLREEFEMLGVPFEGRARRAEEYVEAMRRLWQDEAPSFAGETVRFEDARMWPKPVNGTVPIVLGGHTDAAARRAGRLADGFFPGRSDPEVLQRLLAVMRESAEAAGRDPDAIEVTVGGPPNRPSLERFAALGVHRVVVPPRGQDLESVLAGIDRVAEMAELGSPA